MVSFKNKKFEKMIRIGSNCISQISKWLILQIFSCISAYIRVKNFTTSIENSILIIFSRFALFLSILVLTLFCLNDIKNIFLSSVLTQKLNIKPE